MGVPSPSEKVKKLKIGDWSSLKSVKQGKTNIQTNSFILKNTVTMRNTYRLLNVQQSLHHKKSNKNISEPLFLNMSTCFAGYFLIKPLLVDYCCKVLQIRCFCDSLALNVFNNFQSSQTNKQKRIMFKVLLTKSKILL